MDALIRDLLRRRSAGSGRGPSLPDPTRVRFAPWPRRVARSRPTTSVLGRTPRSPSSGRGGPPRVPARAAGLFDGGGQPDELTALAQEVGTRVQAIAPLAFETGPGRVARHMLVVSPAGDPELREVAERWLAAAPQPDAAFEYATWRQPVPDAEQLVVEYGEWPVALGEAAVVVVERRRQGPRRGLPSPVRPDARRGPRPAHVPVPGRPARRTGGRGADRRGRLDPDPRARGDPVHRARRGRGAAARRAAGLARPARLPAPSRRAPPRHPPREPMAWVPCARPVDADARSA